VDRQYFKMNVAPSNLFHNTVAHVLDIVSQTVGSTFGPGGTVNLFLNGPDIKASKDGLENLTMMKMNGTISRTIHQMLIDIASKQANNVGDGTTSAILITAAVYHHLMNNKELWKRYTASEIHSAMQDIQNEIIKRLEMFSIKVSEDSEIKDLIYTSTDANKKLTELLFNVYKEVKDIQSKNIILDYSNTEEGYFKTVRGIEVDGRLMSRAFGNKNETECVLRNAEILIVDGKVNIMNDILNYVNKLKLHNKSLLIICSGVNENFYRFIETMSQNQPEMLTNFCVVYSKINTVMDKDSFYDVCRLIDSVGLEENIEISSESIENFKRGTASNVSIKNTRMTLGGFRESDGFERHMGVLAKELEMYQDQLDSDKLEGEDKIDITLKRDKLLTRYYRLKDGVTTIYVGGETPQRKHINYRLVEDGLKALQSTLKYGFFLGCNTIVPNTLVYMIREQMMLTKNEDISIYQELEMTILKAYIDVYRKLISNRMTLSKRDIMELIMGPNFEQSYDDQTGYVKIVNDAALFYPVNLRDEEQQIINPAKTDILIVQRALSTALVLATSNTIMTDELEFEATL